MFCFYWTATGQHAPDSPPGFSLPLVLATERTVLLTEFVKVFNVRFITAGYEGLAR